MTPLNLPKWGDLRKQELNCNRIIEQDVSLIGGCRGLLQREQEDEGKHKNTGRILLWRIA